MQLTQVKQPSKLESIRSVDFNLLTGIEETIDDCITLASKIIPVDQISILVFDPIDQFIRFRGDWSRRKTAFKLYPGDALPPYQWTLEQVQKHNIVTIDHLDQLPPAALPETELLRQCGVRSIILKSYKLNEEYKLLIAFSRHNGNGKWSTTSKNRIGTIADWIRSEINQSLYKTQLLEKYQHYQNLFNYAPIAIWEEDFSHARKWLLELPYRNSQELKAFLITHPEIVNNILSTIRVIDVNETTIQLWNHRSREQIIGNLKTTFPEDNFEKWVDELIAIYENKKQHIIENQKVAAATGELIYANLYWNVLPSHEEDWSRVLVSAVDITRQIQTEQSLKESEERLRMILESADDLILLQDLDGKFIYYNGQASYGLTSEDVVGFAPMDLHPHTVADQIEKALTQVLYTKKTYFYEIQMAWGKEVNWFSNRVYPIFSSNGELTSIGTIARNITKRKQTEFSLVEVQKNLSVRVQELERRNQEISLLSEMLTSLQFSSTEDEAYEIIKQSLIQLFSEYTGVLFEVQAKDSSLSPIITWGIDTQLVSEMNLSGILAPRIKDRGNATNIPLSQISISNDEAIFRNNLYQTYIVDGVVSGCLFLQSNLEKKDTLENTLHLAQAATEQIGLALTNIRLRIGLRQQAIHDALTGLYNRHFLEEAFPRELYRQERNNQPLSIIMMDLDHLKRINDFYGHAAGDAVLRELGKLIKRSIRISDIPCRYGGDEFLLVLPETSIETALMRAQKIARYFRELNIPFGTQTLGEFSVSIGIACTTLHGHTQQDLMDAADKALYKAKNAGRDRILVADTDPISDMSK